MSVILAGKATLGVRQAFWMYVANITRTILMLLTGYMQLHNYTSV